MQNIGDHVKQHIQGVLVHGRAMFAYRTFHNLSNTANLQMTCLLLTLNWVIEQDGRLPDTIFYQIDGGAENIKDVVYAFCEMLVVSGLTKCVVVRAVELNFMQFITLRMLMLYRLPDCQPVTLTLILMLFSAIFGQRCAANMF